MRRQVKEIDGMALSNWLYVREFESPNDVITQKRTSGAGTDIVYVMQVKTPEITLESKDSGWLTQTEVAAIRALFLDYTRSFTITYDDDSTDTVRAGIERQDKLKFTPLFECSLDYTVVIPLSKIL